MDTMFLNCLLLSTLVFSGAYCLRAGPEDELIGTLPEYQCPDAGGSFPWVTCDKYVQCINLKASLYQCKLDYFFDLKWAGCNYPELVDCTNRTLPDGSTQAPITTTTKLPTPTFECPSANGNFLNPYDCSSYYVCSNNNAFLVKCPDGLVFNPQTESCDYPSAVDCSQISTLPEGSPTPQVTETTASSTVTVNRTTASSTVTVNRTEPVLNTTLSASEVPTTSSYPTTSQKPDLTTTPGEPFVCPGDGVFPHEDCSMFYQCANGGSTAQTCPPGLTFNPDILACDYPDNFFPPCGTRFPCPEPDGYFPNPDNCESYFVCSGGLSYEQVCSPGLVYNVENNVCDFPFNVPPPCGTASEERELVTDDITEEPITEPTPVWWFDCSIRNGFFPNPEDCTSYINCDNGNAWLLYCPNGTLYDAAMERCTTDASCTTSDFIRTSPNIQTATPDPNFECPEPNGLFANPLDCHSFYQCANSIPIFQLCPGNLHFSVEEQQCLDPAEANCQTYSFNFNN
ncbi:probable chitinase 10 isoform X2 [Artemia franciscana]|uniref:probable chitinase 10 isoform X2 n=1 Tax=Artemia franciscana TaxID=6661 RepID=UPI0032DA6879